MSQEYREALERVANGEPGPRAIAEEALQNGSGPASGTAESCVVTEGEKYRTPFDPSGLVEVISVGSAESYFGHTPVCVRYVEDHPHGYEEGDIGFYCAENLRSPE